jgi:hypothetical protein
MVGPANEVPATANAAKALSVSFFIMMWYYLWFVSVRAMANRASPRKGELPGASKPI